MTKIKIYDKVISASSLCIKGGNEMAVKVTNKKPLFGNKRSHALNATRKKQGVNLQTVRLEDGTRIRMSARELRTTRKDANIEEVSE